MSVPPDTAGLRLPSLPDGYFESDRSRARRPARPSAVRRRSRAPRLLVLAAAAALVAAAFYAGGRYDVDPVSPGSSAPAVHFVDRWSSRVWRCEPPARGHSSPVCRRVPGPPPFGP